MLHCGDLAMNRMARCTLTLSASVRLMDITMPN